MPQQAVMPPPARAARRSSAPLNPQQRAALVLAFALITHAAWPLAQAMARCWDAAALGTPPTHVLKAMKKWSKKFTKEGTVRTARARRKPRLPDAVAKEAADLVEAGYWVTAAHGPAKGHKVRLWYTTINEAVRRVPRLQEILAEYGVRAPHLRKRMCGIDPELRWGRLDIKGALDAPHRAERRGCAEWYEERLATDPAFLDSIVWIDEVKVQLFGGRPKDVSVWRAAHAAGFDEVIPCCGATHSPPTRCTTFLWPCTPSWVWCITTTCQAAARRCARAP